MESKLRTDENLMREYIPGRVQIDGRNIEYRIFSAYQYLRAKNQWSQNQVEEFQNLNYEAFRLINQIMGLKQSCYLLRRTTYSCGSLPEDLFELKLRLMDELKVKFGIDFDDEFVECYGFSNNEE